jgi:hypothetical protein
VISRSNRGEKRVPKSETLPKFGFKDEENTEIARDNSGNQVFDYTGFPKCDHRYRLVYETPNVSIEEIYFWMLEHVKTAQAHPNVLKITDIFTASEQSSFFGTAQQRIGLQQEKVSMFLATIGKMVKELFQLVREVRILKERLGYYEDSINEKSKSRESAEITLKGIWIDMVEQGAKNPASVYGMARELQFVTLPDLFFSIHPLTPESVDGDVEKLDFNRKVKEVLKRKLRQYAEWKKMTYDEMKTRHTFTLKYLRQHFDVIKMYMSWVKPYLRNIRRMEMADRTESAHLVSAFEGSIIELEFLAYRLPGTREIGKEILYNKKYYSVVSFYFYYRSKPQMNYIQEYQRGPLHVGMCDLTMRAYCWTKKDIDNYQKLREHEDLRLLASIDGSVKAAMEALGGELESYLREAGEMVDFAKDIKKDAKSEIKKAIDPFTSVFKGFGEVFGAFGSKSSGDNMTQGEIDREKSAAKTSAKNSIWQTYKNYKKMEGLHAW